ncbi:MAG: carboxymuconolactone decarboxylase family protein [Zoogloeaceae bacterium]|jgi:AhpD family alkylhydroperoxidase|nr:carboxymuconolactone decarboxylase family protein [Zoogloeaceae bacterium]
MSQGASYREVTKQLGGKLKALSAATPEVMKSFQGLHQIVIADGALSAKNKELIAIALSVAAHCEGCIAFHAQALARLGATEAEVADALSVAILMNGGPASMWSAEALSAFRDFSQA